MAGNDLIWLSSIIFVLTLVGWLALDWLEDSQQWEVLEVESAEGAANGVRTSEAIDIEAELLLCYPLDPFAPALLWRPMPQDGWSERQESAVEAAVEETAGYLTPPVALNSGHANPT